MPKLELGDERHYHVTPQRCLRCLLLVMYTYPFAKKALTLYLARGEGRERYFGCNLMQRKVLASSHQHLMAEAPTKLLIYGLFQKGRVLAQDGVPDRCGRTSASSVLASELLC